MRSATLRAAVAALAAGAVLSALIAGCAVRPPQVVNGGSGPNDETPDWAPDVKLTPVWSGFSQPVLLTHAGDGSGRLFVVELGGRVSVIRGGTVLAEPFLDLSRLASTGGERGLFSIAFPMDYASNGVFYVDYTDTGGDSVIARYRVSDDPDRADPGSAEIVLRVEQPYANHNGGQLAFGPDGMLFVGFGDGGGAGDPEDRGQDPTTLLGKLLRLDVSGADGYDVPSDNPFVNDSRYRPEIWALGLRNPWRFSFDTGTGDLYIADVGQNALEEIDVEPAASAGGLNYGWNLFEGSRPYPAGADQDPGGMTMPVVEYGRSAGQSVTGGFVYRGTHSPRLAGIYFYADFGSGRLWALQRTSAAWRTQLLLETGRTIAGFGQDEAGDVYVLDFQSGEVLRIDAE